MKKATEAAMSSGVVVHLDEAEPTKHATVLRNVSNLLDALDPGTQIELVVHGPAIGILLPGGPHSEIVRALQNRGLAVVACQNTLRSEHISPEQLIPDAAIVPSGVAHLVLRQREGWAYLRP
ncbi:DsrE family protein [Leifsonia sp. TF02-11]|uniref:DsrE family protein n=1 Tax=Leifsonia sp. TF02-11 TaxID=2815212 RepID=UPI001AA159A9|nr:DsrE family protein [Leifsonia sp. TF02-11]MBO1741569.1 DsrE family protein [Leifsonia sp. TF02-11]